MRIDADVTLWKLAAALGFGLVLAAVGAFVVLRQAQSGRTLFRSIFLALICVYALGFAARFALIEIMP